MRTRPSSIWYGLGTMGVIGWNVAIPTTLGVLVGNWLDRYVPMSFSWVLTGMIGGVLVGCLNAWGWITSERRKIQARRIDENREE